MDIEYLGRVYTDKEMEMVRRFSRGDVVRDSEPFEFRRMEAQGLIRKRRGTHVEVDVEDKKISLMPTTKTTPFGNYVLWRYDHPVMASAEDGLNYARALVNEYPIVLYTPHFTILAIAFAKEFNLI